MTFTKVKLISIEGIDGSGKTTLAQNIRKKLVADYQLFVALLREPGGTEEGEAIRNILKSSPNLNPISAFLLFSAARMELQKKLLEASTNDLIILDRYYDSTYAYQVAAGVPLDLVESVTRRVVKHKPALTIFLDIEPELALERLKAQGDTEDNQDINYLREVRNIYKQRIALEPNRFLVFDATYSIEALTEKCVREILRLKQQSMV